MKPTTKLIASILVFSSLILNINSAYSTPDINKYAWPPDYNSSDTSRHSLLGYYFTLYDDFLQNDSGEGVSFIRTDVGMQRWCTDFNDQLCKREVAAGGHWWTNQVLPPCNSAQDLISCIEAVNLVKPNGSLERYKFEKLVTGNTWAADPSIGLEAGSSTSRWVSSQDSGSNKGLKVTVSGYLGIGTTPQKTISNVNLTSFQASVEPYELMNGNFSASRIYESPDGFRSFSRTSINPNYCNWIDTNECGVQSDFPAETKVQLVLHLPLGISGWLLGRLSEPEFKNEFLGLSRVSNQALERVTLTGYPVEVPLFSTKVENSEASPELIKDLQENSFCNSNPTQCKGYFGYGSASSYFDYTYKRFQLFESYLKNTATIIFPRWSIRSLQSVDKEYERCRANTASINGIVTTNASIYQGSPPTFNNDEFTYKVAGLHYLPNKEEFKGSYNLVLRSEFARCLYGFSNAPLTASVEVTNSDGTNKVVTSSFSEKNSWLSLSIKGFTFSQPTIKTKFSQVKEILPSPTPSPSVSEMPSSKAPVTIKKSSITCTKGKVTKEVTAVNPKCPVGYKKK